LQKEFGVLILKGISLLKMSLEKQLMNAIDLVGANLSKGFGKYFYKENKQFCYYSRESLSEIKTQLRKAFNRKLV